MDFIEINKQDYLDTISGKANNPTMQAELRRLTTELKLLLNDVDGIYFPEFNPDGSPLLNTVIINYNGLGEYWQNIGEMRAIEFARTIKLSPYRTLGLFGETIIFKRDDVNALSVDYIGKYGIPEDEAALELGLTLESFRNITPLLIYSSIKRYYDDFLRGFRNSFLTSKKTWTNRTSLLEEFIRNYNEYAKTNGRDAIVGQKCGFESCPNLAINQCVNNTCKKYICPVHCGEWVETSGRSDVFAPKCLCSNCSTDDGYNLHGFKKYGTI